MKTRHFSAFTKILSVTLSLLLVLLGLPLAIFAEDLREMMHTIAEETSDAGTGNTAEGAASAFLSKPFEETALRTETTKTYRLPDGSHYLAAYDAAVHIRDAEGKLQDIDNTLKETDGIFSTPDGRFRFPEGVEDGTLTLLHDFGNASLAISAVNVRKDVRGEIQKETPGNDPDSPWVLPGLVSSLCYPDAWENTDLRYVLNGNDVHVSAVLQSPGKPGELSFEIAVSGLVAETSEDGEIRFLNAVSGSSVCRISAPAMWDAERKERGPVKTVISAENQKEGETLLRITYVPDMQWLQGPERKYPVTLGLSLPTERESSVLRAEVNHPAEKDGAAPENGERRAYWKMDGLPALPLLARITDAALTLPSGIGRETGLLAVYEVLSDWDAGITAEAMENPDAPAGLPAEICMDYVAADGPDSLTFRITAAAAEWFTGENRGLVLMPAEPARDTGTFPLLLPDADYVSSAPVLTVTYTSDPGLEDYWSYTSLDAGAAGSAHINNATGNLVITVPTLGTLDSLLPLTPTLVYNYCMDFAEYSYGNAQTANLTSHTARSFKLNLNETLIKTYYDGTGTCYIWADGDGTEHIFESESDGTYTDVDGLHLLLRELSGGNVTVTDASGMVRTFSPCPYPQDDIPDDILNALYLSSITDRAGNSAVFAVANADTSNRITEISIQPNGHSSISQLKLLYNSAGKLSCVYNPHTGEGVVFRYSGTYAGTVGTAYGGYLRQTVRAHGSTVDSDWVTFYGSNSNAGNGTVSVDSVSEYTYNYLGLMTGMRDGETGYRLNFTTYSTKRISTAYESETAGGTQGQKLDFTYLADSTVIESAGKDDTLYTGDDIRTFYTFDSASRCISQYSTDMDGNMVYGFAAADYVDREENGKAANNLRQSTVLSDIAVNLLTNPRFCRGGTCSTQGWNRSAGGITLGTVHSYSDSVYPLDYLLELKEGTARTYLEQDVILHKGTYTFSADLLTMADTAGMEARLVVWDTSAGEIITSRKVDFRSVLEVPQNLCPSVSFQVDGSESYITVGIEISASAYPSDDHSLSLRQVSLTKALGTGLFSMAEFGGFESTSWDEVPAERWSGIGDGNTVVSGVSPDGACLRMNGAGYSQQNICRQTVFETTAADYNAFLNRQTQYRRPAKQFRLSAAGKSTGSNAGTSASFSAALQVTYWGSGNGVTETCPLEFSRDTEAWQYASAVMTVPEDRCVKKIEILLNYSGQTGTAWFDDISFCFVGVDEGVTDYSYTASGMPSEIRNGTSGTVYRYANESGETQHIDGGGSGRSESELATLVTQVIGTEYATVYTYSSDLEVREEKMYRYTRQEGASFYGFSAGSAHLLSTVTHTRNQYGQEVQTQTAANGSTVRTSTEYLTGDSAYDFIFGAVCAVTDELGYRTRYFYSPQTGRLEAVLGPDGNGIKYSYDSRGRLTQVQDAVASGNSYALTPGTSVHVNYSYSQGRLTGISTDSTSYTIAYDNFGRRTSVHAGGSLLASYTYHAQNGKLTQINYGNGQKERYLYDALDRVSEIQYNSNGGNTFTTAYRYTYDAAGNVYSIKDVRTGSASETYYVTDTGGKTVGYAATGPNGGSARGTLFYDKDGKLSETELLLDPGSVPGVVTCRSTYSYDTANGELHQQTILFSSYGMGQDSGVQHQYVTTYTYDALQRVTNTQTVLTDPAIPHEEAVLNTAYGYAVPTETNTGNTSTRISSFSTRVNGTSALQYSYIYDANGNITEIWNGNTVICRYRYDSLGQLIREDNTQIKQGGTGGTTFLYEYDDAGNLKAKKIRAYTTLENPAATLTKNYTYYTGLWKDQLKTYDGEQIQYDGMGNPIRIGDDTLEWTQGRLLAGYYEDGGVSLEFTYNADGIRTSKTVDGVTHYYLLDGSTVLSEEWTDGTRHILMVYVYDAAGSPIGFRCLDSNDSSGKFHSYIYQKNLQGDIVGI